MPAHAFLQEETSNQIAPVDGLLLVAMQPVKLVDKKLTPELS